MNRCLQLAKLGIGYVAPNPMVGAVLVYSERIIGEGYHHQYGEPHAEVHCIKSVADADEHLISQSTLYINLEPCTHFGKTPPCTDLILKKKIPRVVIGCSDPFEKVNGKGVEKLRKAGVEVDSGILENECKKLNKRFFLFHIQKRPYIILKWAQTANGFIAGEEERLLISGDYANCIVHKWRSEEASIMIGTNTAMMDDPSLTTRLWKGNNPVRLILDKHLRLPKSLKVFDKTVKTIVFNTVQEEKYENILLYKIEDNENVIQQICNVLYDLHIQSVLVEGGRKLLQSFINEGLYDEVRIIKNNSMLVEKGLTAPVIPNMVLQQQFTLLNDEINIFIDNKYSL